MKRWMNLLITAGMVFSELAGPAFCAEPAATRVLTLEESHKMALERNY